MTCEEKWLERQKEVTIPGLGLTALLNPMFDLEGVL